MGSGSMGRIIAKDVETVAATTSASLLTTVPVAAAPVRIELGSVVLLTTMQSAISRNMLENLTVPTFRVSYTITTDALYALY